MTDFFIAEEIAEMINKTVPERLMYGKGIGAYGSFKPYMNLEDFTEAGFLQSPDIETPVFVRFSRTFGKRGSADTGRDTRGFCVKFFTDEGVFDLVCHNMPMYYINNPKDFPSLIKAMATFTQEKGEARERFWGFVADHPESIPLVTWLFSNRGTIKSYRHIEGYGINTLKLETENGRRFYTRFKWSPMDGVRDISRQEAEFLAGFEPDIAGKDLISAISGGYFPSYELSMQTIEDNKAEALNFDLLNPTIFWSEKQFPSIKVGKMILNKTPEDYENEVEKSTFSPSNLVRGIGLWGDSFTTAMCFAHNESGRHRRGW